MATLSNYPTTEQQAAQQAQVSLDRILRYRTAVVITTTGTYRAPEQSVKIHRSTQVSGETAPGGTSRPVALID